MKKYKYCGFTLIELLAVIVILSIIALIATPIVLNIIEDTKVSSIKTSSELYMNAVELSLGRAGIDNVDISTCKVENKILKCGDKEYKIEIKVEHPDEVEIKATQSGKIYTAMKRDNYCIMIKEGENSLSYKKIVNIVKDSNNEITNNNCTLDPYTSENCFAFDGTTGTITDYYNYENNGKKQNECPRDVLIPSKINNIEVTTIGNSAFRNKNITSAEIPSSVTTIELAAFMNNDIVNLKLPNSVTTIAQSAFNGNEIINLELPNSVTTIGPYAFQNNNIETLKLPEGYFTVAERAFGNNNLSPENAFIYARKENGEIDYTTIITYGGLEIENIIIPGEKNGVVLTTIGSNAFSSQGIKGVTIPEGVTTIGNSAFRDNNITSVEIPSSVVTVDGAAFMNNSIVNLKLSDGLTTINQSAFNDNEITTVEIPNSVTTIGPYAFTNNNITNVTIKNKQENVILGSKAFGTFDTTNIVWDYLEQ